MTAFPEIAPDWGHASEVMQLHELREVLREYVRLRINTEYGGNVAAFSRAVGYPKSTLSVGLSGKGEISLGVLSRVSERIGPSMSVILRTLAAMAAESEAERDAQAHARKLHAAPAAANGSADEPHK